MLFSAGVVAQDIKIIGQIDIPTHLPNTPSSASSEIPPVVHIALLKVELSAKARQKIEHRAEKVLHNKTILAIEHTTKIQLGMNNVPVLNQGSYGSCVTFANAAAIDAILNKGDYVSELCLLQLGRYLEKNGYNPSGWNGSLGGIVLNQMTSFGFINKTLQRSEGCGGLKEYPLFGIDSESNTEMTPVEYHQFSESLDGIVGWSSVVDNYQVTLDKIELSHTLKEIKSSLIAGERLTFGVLLPDAFKGVAGAIGKHHARYDSWVLTPEIVQDMKSETDLPGHEMVITGYDDDAVALDDHGRTHKGLFTLRNSWGEYIGDKGDFYMSYDYFSALVIETQRIRDIRS